MNVCEYERKLALSSAIGQPDQHCLIYNGVHEVGPEYRADPGRLGTVRFVSIARFESPKDHTTLLKAVSTSPRRLGSAILSAMALSSTAPGCWQIPDACDSTGIRRTLPPSWPRHKRLCFQPDRKHFLAAYSKR